MKNVDKLNDLIEYIEINLEKNISDDEMCRILGVNSYTLYRIFLFVTDISLTDYIRNRRLSKAALDIINSDKKIIDIAYNYGYNSPDGFSRAFFKFHGIKPSEVKKKYQYLKNYPPYHFNNADNNFELDYRIEESNAFELNGYSFECDANQIKIMAPEFWKQKMANNAVKEILDNNISYGIIQFDENYPINTKTKYYIASNKKLPNSSRLVISSSKWAIFKLKTFENRVYDGNYFYNFSHYVYTNWIPYTNYNISSLPELEVYYPDGQIEWWLPIE